MVEISITPETVFHIGSFPVTNSLLTSWIVVAGLAVGAIVFSKKLKKVPNKIQNLAEFVIETFLNFLETVAGDAKIAKQFFPIVATLFIFIVSANWIGILPGFGSVGIMEKTAEGQNLVPLFRTVYSDLNMALALAVITVLLSHIFGILTISAKHHFGKFLTIKSPIAAFSGALEIVGEISKIVSLSFRLFGNIFAGEVLLTIVAFLVPFLAPLPFIGLELFVGFVQALIFSVLAMVAFSGFAKAHS